MQQYVAVDPNGGLAYNCINHSPFFSSIKQCRQAVFDELDSVEAIDFGSSEAISMSEERGWYLKDYRFFKEVE